MPIAIGLHLAIAIFFAVHAVRTGQQTYWLFILLSFPGLGSLIYFLTIYLPSSRLQRGATKLARAAAKSLDPTRELREAQSAYDYAPTAQNQLRLAQALLEVGQAQQAMEHFEQCLQGIFSADLEIRWSAARAALDAGHAPVALRHLQEIRAQDARFRQHEITLLLAKTHAALGDTQDARTAFEEAVARNGDFESKAEYAIWAAGQGDSRTAQALNDDLQASIKRWNRQQRDFHRDLIRRLNKAFE